MSPSSRTFLAAALACCTGLHATIAVAGQFVQAGTVYQWKDAAGVTHSSDKPPVGVKYEVRRIASHDTVATQAAPAGQPVEPPQCTTARSNLELLQAPGPVDQEVDGKRQVLNDEQRAVQKQLAEVAIKAYCPPT